MMRMRTRATLDNHHSRPSRRGRLALVALSTAAITGLALMSGPPSDAAPLGGNPSHEETAASVPALRSQEAPSTAVVTGGGVVTLVTGDRVLVKTYSDGRSVSSLLPGSPPFGKPVSTASTPTGSYVIPRLPIAERLRLDPSLFNVTALLGQAKGRVEVEVTFSPGTKPRNVAGLTLETARAHRGSGGSTVVPGHYSTSTPGVAAQASAWQGVSSVDLPTGQPAAALARNRLQTLTVHVVDTQGAPVGSELAWVINMDDGKRFLNPLEIIDGVGTVSVPTGNYAVVAGTFNLTVIQTDIAVQTATTVELSLADATVQTSETVPGHSPVEADYTMVVLPEGGGSFTGGSTGPRFSMKVQPVRAALLHGTVWSIVDGTFAPSGEVRGQIYSSLAYVKDYRRGVPSLLSFSHPRTDFAIVPQRFHGNGPAGTRLTFIFSFAPMELGSFASGYPVRVPGVRTIWLQGSRQLAWTQSLDAVGSFFREDGKLAILDKSSVYTPGLAQPVNFAHGPVGPGFEARYDRGSTGPSCVLCRRGDQLRGLMPLFTGAGTGMSGLLLSPDMGSWTLTHGVHSWGSGNYVIAPDVTLPAGSQQYTLTASSHPGLRAWQMSTDVTDVWRFVSGSSDAVIPLLMPSYVPRTALNGTLRPGHVRWPLDFGNIGPADAPVTMAKVSLSTDEGQHWRPATVTRVDKNSFAVTYTNPASTGSTTYMSLRVTGVDSAGRTVTETATRAYRLTPAE